MTTKVTSAPKGRSRQTRSGGPRIDEPRTSPVGRKKLPYRKAARPPSPKLKPNLGSKRSRSPRRRSRLDKDRLRSRGNARGKARDRHRDADLNRHPRGPRLSPRGSDRHSGYNLPSLWPGIQPRGSKEHAMPDTGSSDQSIAHQHALELGAVMYLRGEFAKYIDTNICAVAELIARYGVPTVGAHRATKPKIRDYITDAMRSKGAPC